MRPIDSPWEPEYPGGGGGGTGGGGGGEPEQPPPNQLPGLGAWLVRRYTSNVVASEEMPLLDFFHEVMFPAARMFISQGANGKIRLQNHKPVDWALGTEAFTGDEIGVDDVAPWLDDTSRFLLIDPHTAQSEVRVVTDAEYSLEHNDVTLTGDALFTITGFAGATGPTPATATVVVGAPTPATTYSITLDGYEVQFIAGDDDTEDTIAAFLKGTFEAHPGIRRKFSFAVSTDTLTITGKFGTLTLDSALTQTHTAPIDDPLVAPTLASSAGSLPAGEYFVAYTQVNSHGQTLLSPFKAITLGADEQIDVDAVALETGATSIRWYVVPEAGSVRFRYHSENDGSAFSIDSLPKLTAPLPPDLNRSGTEVMRVSAWFSDREEERSGAAGSNVIKSSMEWLLGNRKKSVNLISLKYRDANQDWRIIDLHVRDDAHIAKVRGEKPEEINGQAIDNYFQALRIAAGELAVKRDADFFYKWKATRGANLLEEGDVVCITDDGSGVVNLPVEIQEISMEFPNASMPRCAFTGMKYSTSLYDDSVVEREIPVVSEPTEVEFA